MPSREFNQSQRMATPGKAPVVMEVGLEEFQINWRC